MALLKSKIAPINCQVSVAQGVAMLTVVDWTATAKTSGESERGESPCSCELFCVQVFLHATKSETAVRERLAQNRQHQEDCVMQAQHALFHD